LADPELRTDPYPVYRAYHSRGSVQPGIPGVRLSAPHWYVFGYGEVMSALKDPRLLRRSANRISGPASPNAQAFWSAEAATLIFQDPPAHTRLRAVVGKRFTPTMLDALVPAIEARTRELLDTALAKGEMDAVREFALPLALFVIARILGVTPHDFECLESWAEARRDVYELVPGEDPEPTYERAANAAREFTEFARSEIRKRAGARGNDLLSDLVCAGEEDRLSEEELIGMCRLIVSAGHETTVNLVANGLFALLTHPSEYRALVERPALISGAVDELLRFETPVQLTRRFASEDLSLGGAKIARGDGLTLLFGAANRDPAVFGDPDRLELSRRGPPSVSFGAGIHACLGTALARLEGRVALGQLVSRAPSLLLVPEEARRTGFVFRGFSRLGVRTHN
jgi:cytochrome P450